MNAIRLHPSRVTMRNPIQLLVSAAAVLVASSVAGAQCADKLFYPGSTGQPNFGHAIALSGDDLVIGSPQAENAALVPHGLAYHYRRTPAGWVLAQIIEPASGGGANTFGSSVAISGDTILIGDGNHNPTFQTGAVHFYERAPAGFVLDQTIEGQFPSEFFGARAAMDGDVAFIAGGFFYGPRLYERTPGGWVETLAMPVLGSIVAVDGDVAVSANPTCSGVSSAVAHVLERTPGGWTHSSISSPLGPNDCFGAALAVSGDVLMIGATQYSLLATPPGAGLVLVYERGPTGWELTQELRAADANTDYGFGARITLDGDRALITAPGPSNGFMFPGLVYVFERTSTGWAQTRRLQPQPSLNRDYGDAHALAPDLALIADPRDPFTNGNPQGSVQVVPLPPTEARYCDSTPNSTGETARLFVSGCPSIAANEIKFVAGPVPVEIGLFVYGAERVNVPLGNGVLCVGAPSFRIGIQTGQGNLTHSLDVTDPPVAAAQITAGSTWFFQAWFRDFAALGEFFNTSDAVSITFGN